MEASKEEWINPNDIQYEVNSLRLSGLHILCIWLYFMHFMNKYFVFFFLGFSHNFYQHDHCSVYNHKHQPNLY